MADVCKRHGKPRDTIVKRGAFTYVGCVDCKNGVASVLDPQKDTSTGKRGKKKSSSAKPDFEPSPASGKPSHSKKEAAPTPVKKEGGSRGFFGFKL